MWRSETYLSTWPPTFHAPDNDLLQPQHRGCYWHCWTPWETLTALVIKQRLYSHGVTKSACSIYKEVIVVHFYINRHRLSVETQFIKLYYTSQRFVSLMIFPEYGQFDSISDTDLLQHTFMMTSSNGDIFRVTGHLCGEFTGPRWIPRTKASDAELWWFLWSASE